MQSEVNHLAGQFTGPPLTSTPPPPPPPVPFFFFRSFLQALRISVWETVDLFVDTSSVYFYVGTNSVYKSLAHEQPTDSSPHPPRLSSRSFPVYAWQGVSPVLSFTHCFAMEKANVLFCNGGGKLLVLSHGEGKRIILPWRRQTVSTLPWRRQTYDFAMEKANVLFCHGGGKRIILPWRRQGYYFAMQEESVLFCHGVLPWMRQT